MPVHIYLYPLPLSLASENQPCSLHLVIYISREMAIPFIKKISSQEAEHYCLCNKHCTVKDSSVLKRGGKFFSPVRTKIRSQQWDSTTTMYSLSFNRLQLLETSTLKFALRYQDASQHCYSLHFLAESTAGTV